jgi:hypothetical protein
MKRAVLLAFCLAAGALQSPNAMADPAPQRVHGSIKSFDGQYLMLKADSGQTVTIGVQPATHIVHSRTIALADLKSGDSVGTLALMGADNKLRAQAIRVFPSGMQGNGEGQYPLESNASRMVTNGTIAAVASTPSGGALTVSFHGAATQGTNACTGHAAPDGCTGTADLIIARGVPIIAMSDSDTTLLLPGAIVSVFATADPASLLTADSIIVERDGKPAQ